MDDVDAFLPSSSRHYLEYSFLGLVVVAVAAAEGTPAVWLWGEE